MLRPPAIPRHRFPVQVGNRYERGQIRRLRSRPGVLTGVCRVPQTQGRPPGWADGKEIRLDLEFFNNLAENAVLIRARGVTP